MLMKENVPLVKEISVGIDFLHSARSYDLILQVTLESKDKLEAYQNDPSPSFSTKVEVNHFYLHH